MGGSGGGFWAGGSAVACWVNCVTGGGSRIVSSCCGLVAGGACSGGSLSGASVSGCFRAGCAFCGRRCPCAFCGRRCPCAFCSRRCHSEGW